VSVRLSVDQFQIKKDQIRSSKKQEKILLRAVTAGVKQNMQAIEAIDHFGNKLCLKERFATRKSYATIIRSQDRGLLV
jgi:hypothetical protein